MKNTIKNITFATCLVATCTIHGTAFGTVGCMTVPSTSSSSTPASYSIEWSRGDEYGGIAVCTDEDQGTNVDKLDIRLNDNAFATCYCKLLRPAVSKWLKITAASYDLGCNAYCAQNCRALDANTYNF